MATTVATLSVTSATACPCCGGRDCCPDGDPPDSLCVTFDTGVVYVNSNPESVPGCGAASTSPWWAGNSYTLTRGTPPSCSWSYSASGGRSIGVFLGDNSDPDSPPTGRVWTAQINGLGATGISYSLSTGQTLTAPPSGSLKSLFMRYRCGSPDAAAPGVAYCLPVTFGAFTGGGNYAGGGDEGLYWAGNASLAAGACGEGFMAVAPTLATAAAPAPVARPGICRYAERVEHLAGCGGFRCRHLCTSPDPAVRAALGESDIVVPADECQTCDGYSLRPAAGQPPAGS